MRWILLTLIECRFLGDDGEVFAIRCGMYFGDVLAVEEDLTRCWFVEAGKSQQLAQTVDG